MNYLEDLAASLRYQAERLERSDTWDIQLVDLMHRAADAIEEADRRPKKQSEAVETNMYDREEIIENCTVQVLTNSITGEVAWGWWRNDPADAKPT